MLVKASCPHGHGGCLRTICKPGRNRVPCMTRKTRASAAGRDGDRMRKSSTSRSMTGCSCAGFLLPCELGAHVTPDICEKPVGVGLCVMLPLSAHGRRHLSGLCRACQASSLSWSIGPVCSIQARIRQMPIGCGGVLHALHAKLTCLPACQTALHNHFMRSNELARDVRGDGACMVSFTCSLRKLCQARA